VPSTPPFGDIFCVVLSWMSSESSVSCVRAATATQFRRSSGASKKLTVAQRILWQACSALLRWQAQDKRRKGGQDLRKKGWPAKGFQLRGRRTLSMCVCQLLESPLNDFANRISPISQAAKGGRRIYVRIRMRLSRVAKGVHLTGAKVNRKLIRPDLPDLFVPTHNRNYSSWNFH